MSTNIEIEAKILVSKQEFERVKHYLKLENTIPISQTNHYIDNNLGHLRQYGFALRIREIDNQYTLTLKSPMAEGTLEKNQVISQEEYQQLKVHHQFPKGKVQALLYMFGFKTSSLVIIADLTTQRIDTSFQGQHVCLDVNSYNGLIDYEIESEQSSLKYAAETLQKLCSETGINYQENHVSKYARAIAHRP
jgi:uncharacterized protein YjbK